MKDSTAERIIQTASELMTDLGVPGTTLGEIAKQLGMSKGTLYYYFPSKQELVSAVASDCIKKISDRLFSWVDSVNAKTPPEDTLGELCDAFLEDSALRLFVAVYNGAEPESELEESVDRAMSEWNVMTEVGALRMEANAAARMKRILPAVVPFLCGLAALNADGDYAKAAFTAFVLG